MWFLEWLDDGTVVYVLDDIEFHLSPEKASAWQLDEHLGPRRPRRERDEREPPAD